MTLPSLEPVYRAVRRIRDLENSLAKAREDRDDRILDAVDGGWKQAHISQKLRARFGDFPGIAPQTIVEAIKAARSRRADKRD